MRRTGTREGKGEEKIEIQKYKVAGRSGLQLVMPGSHSSDLPSGEASNSRSLTSLLCLPAVGSVDRGVAAAPRPRRR